MPAPKTRVRTRSAAPVARGKPRSAPSRGKAPAPRTEPDRRGELVRAAYELIAAKGLEGLRTRDVAARVGINIATLHYYFDTKESLIAGVVGYATELFRTQHAPPPPTATALDELRHVFTGHASRRRRTDSQLDAVMQEILLRARRDARVQKELASMLAAWQRAIAGIVERGVRDGLLREDVAPATAAAVITSFLMGVDLQAGLTAPAVALDEAARFFLPLLARPVAGRPKRGRR